MPELPEVETVRRGLAASLTGRRIAEVVLRRETLREPFPDRFAERLAGRRIEGFDRRGKYLLVHLDDRQVLIAHLGMSGRFAVADAPLGGPHEHVLIRFDEGGVLSYTDHRRFGVMTLAAREALAAHRLLAGMGPEPLGAGFTGAALARRLETKRTPIKAALLDQKTVAGLGNIYICEALFRARLSPRRSAHTVRGKRAERLVTAIKAVLGEAIDSGGSTLRDYAQASGELGYFQHRFQVYDREGEPCPGCDCAGGIRRIVQSSRSTFYCAERQR